MRNRKNNKKVYILVVILLILSISVGYAYLSQDLKFDTSVSITPERDTFLINELINQAVEDTDINFGDVSSDTNGKGVYKLTKIETSTPIYYYRGNVDNNYVLFGGFCWKMLRTTETGGVKIIYNGVPTNGVCNATGDATEIEKSAFNSSDAGVLNLSYMHSSHSTIKAIVDAWFGNNIERYLDYLEDTPFYNERDWVPGTDFDQSYAPRQRIWGNSRVTLLETVANTTIRLGAATLDDAFTVSTEIGNGMLRYPVGLITTDEIVMAGGKGSASDADTTANNKTYYLRTGSAYWTMSPCHYFNGKVGVALVGPSGNLDRNSVSVTIGVRPVVSLKPGTYFLKGDGTIGSPFVITE